MKYMPRFITLCFAFAVFAATPFVSLAHLPTGQTVTRLNEDTFLFTLTYSFSFLGYETAMPMVAVRGLQYETSAPYLGYDLFTKDGERVQGGESAAVVLSGADITSGAYLSPQGTATDFMLVALATVPETSADEGIYLQVTKLPFTLVKGTERLPSQLSKAQLESYQTRAIE